MAATRISILINGHLVDIFYALVVWGKGILSLLLLFVIAEEFISRSLATLVQSNELVPMASAPFHLLYADDVLLFGKGTIWNIKNGMDTFKVYSDLSSQALNWEKSFLCLGNAIFHSRQHILMVVSSMKHGFLPFIYLGSLYLKGIL